MVAVGNHVWWFFWGDEWFFVGNASEKTWEWIVLMGFFSDGFSDYQKLNFWWLPTVNCWIFGLPISPFKKAAAKEYAGCAFAEQGSSTDPSKLWNPLIVLLTDKKIRALPCLSQQVPPTGCDCIVHGPHGLGIHLDSCFMGIRSASCGLAGESPTMHQQNLMNHSTTSRITLFLESYSFHLSLISKNNTKRRMYNESRQN